MTVPQQSAAPASEASAALVDTVLAAAAALAAALPLPTPLVPAPGAPAELPDGDAVAVTTRVSGELSGTLTIIGGADVVAALAAGPRGPMDPAAALQPALDAAAVTLGGQADAAVALDPAEAIARAGAQVLAVPLAAGAVTHALVLADLVPAGRPAAARSRQAGIDLLRDVEMEVTVEIGRTRMMVRELLALTPGTVVELDRAAGSPADLLVNGTLLARGEIVVVDEDFGIRITEIVSSGTDLRGAGLDGAPR